MKLMTLKQYMKMSKPALIRKITKTLTAMPKNRLAVLCYNITKLKLTELKTIKGGRMIIQDIRRKRQVGSLLYKSGKTRRKTKRKFSRKQLAAHRLFAKRARAGTLRRR